MGTILLVLAAFVVGILSGFGLVGWAIHRAVFGLR